MWLSRGHIQVLWGLKLRQSGWVVRERGLFKKNTKSELISLAVGTTLSLSFKVFRAMTSFLNRAGGRRRGEAEMP